MREVQSPKRESARHSTHDVKIDPHPPFDTLKIFEQQENFHDRVLNADLLP